MSPLVQAILLAGCGVGSAPMVMFLLVYQTKLADGRDWSANLGLEVCRGRWRKIRACVVGFGIAGSDPRP